MPHSIFFFFNDTATTEIYTLSLHDALPISLAPDPDAFGRGSPADQPGDPARRAVDRHALCPGRADHRPARDRKSTRLNSSHLVISYAVFCLKKKKNRPDP